MTKPLAKEPSNSLVHYGALLNDIKIRVRQAQLRANLSANAEMICLYWDIGCMIAERKKQEKWGTGLLPRLAKDLKNKIPEIKGFSARNLQLMIQFHREYPNLLPIAQPPVAQLLKTPSFPAESPEAPSVKAEMNEAQMMQQVVTQLPWAHNLIKPYPRKWSPVYPVSKRLKPNWRRA